MKKWFLSILFVLLVGMLPATGQTYTINDLTNDAIGMRTFESYGLDVYNFTPGVNSGTIAFDLFTNYPSGGLQVGAWNTQPADLFVTETYYGNNYLWAFPLVSHDGFEPGNMYAVGSVLTSDNFDPSGGTGGYIYNHGIPVRINTVGNNYGYTSFGGGSVAWNSTGGTSPDWSIRVTTGIYEDDPNGSFGYLWGTATCANDVIDSNTPVPEPATMLLLGSGLVGLGGYFRRRKNLIKP